MSQLAVYSIADPRTIDTMKMIKLWEWWKRFRLTVSSTAPMP